MSAFPASPRVLRGALVSVGIEQPVPAVVPFQYNPASVTRKLETTGGSGGPTANRFVGAPVETITLDISLDATDGHERGDPITKEMGILPWLSALETMIYPSAARMLVNGVLAATGTIEILPAAGNLQLLVWSWFRVVPIAVGSFSITEEAYDPQLRPIRARVSLGLRVLSYDDLSVTHPGFSVFLAHHLAKEALAKAGLAQVIGGAQ
ncbi:MAG: hypothetical protein AAGA48_20720 [Myxococcota bacterium]